MTTTRSAPVLWFKKPRTRMALAALLVFTMFLVGITLATTGAVSPNDIRDAVGRFGPLGSLVFICVFVVGNLLHMPAAVFISAGAVAFGPLLGTALSVVAASIGAVLNLLYIRRLSGTAPRAMKNAHVTRVLDNIESRPLRTVLVLRLVFNTSPALSAGLAFTAVKLRPYVIGSVIGMTPMVALVAYAVDAAMF